MDFVELRAWAEHMGVASKKQIMSGVMSREYGACYIHPGSALMHILLNTAYISSFKTIIPLEREAVNSAWYEGCTHFC